MHHKNWLILRLFYGFVIIVCLYPVLAHIIMYKLDIFTNKLPHGAFWELIQIFFSGPVLLIAGLLLLFRAKAILARILGLLLIGLSIYWLYGLVTEIINES